MAKRNKGSVDNIDDYIFQARKAGFDYLADKAEGLKVYFDKLKKLNADTILTFEEFLNLKDGEKYIFVCFQDDEYSFCSIEEKGEIEIDGKKLQFSTSSGDPCIEFELKEEIKDIPDESDGEYTYTIYSIRTRKKKIAKLLNNE
jgi:hypothetical protein